MPMKDESGNAAIQFLFSQSLQPFLLNLREYVAINFLEVIPLKSTFSIRMFQVFRAHRDRMGKYQNRSTLRYDLEDFKGLLGVEGKYDDYRNLRKKVLEVIIKEINEHTSIEITYKPLKKGRSVAAVMFEFWDKSPRAKKVKQKGLFDGLKLKDLSYSQTLAFDKLVAYGVTDGVALEMISKVKGSEFICFEDWYFDEVVQIFERKTNQEAEGAKAGTLVVWFLKMKVFEQGDHFAAIMERIQNRKKQLQEKTPTKWDNRMLSKGITATEFQQLFKNGKRK